MEKGQNCPNFNTAKALKELMGNTNIKNSRSLAKAMYQNGHIKIGDNSKETDINNARRTIDRHLNGEGVSSDWMKRYCDYFKCSADYLLGYIEYPTHTTTDIHKETGLSESAIKYLQEKSRSKRYTDILNILLRPGNFDNALYHISEYIEAAYLYNGLRKIKDDKKQKMIDECLEKDGDLRSYNCSQYNSLDTMIKESEIKKDVEELRIDQNFKYIIQEIADIARKRNLNTFKIPNSTTK